MIRWGKAGAGILFICGNEILLLLRSAEVEEPLTWGIPGGSISGEDYFASQDIATELPPQDIAWQGAWKEAWEELGSVPECKPFDSVLYKEGGFTYTTFLVRISVEQKVAWNIHLNWENLQWKWFPISRLPGRLHFGVKYIIEQRPALFKEFAQFREPLVDIPSQLYHGTSLENFLAIIEYGGLSPGRGRSPHRTITRNALFYSDDPQAALLYADELFPVILEVNSQNIDIEPDWDDASALIQVDLSSIVEELDPKEDIGLGYPLSEETADQIYELLEWGISERSEPSTVNIAERDGISYLIAEPHVRLSVDTQLMRIAPDFYEDDVLGFDEGSVFYLSKQYLSYQELYFNEINGVWLPLNVIQNLELPLKLAKTQVSLTNYSSIPGLEDIDVDSLRYDDPRLEDINFKEEDFYLFDIYQIREFLNRGQLFFWRH